MDWEKASSEYSLASPFLQFISVHGNSCEQGFAHEFLHLASNQAAEVTTMCTRREELYSKTITSGCYYGGERLVNRTRITMLFRLWTHIKLALLVYDYRGLQQVSVGFHPGCTGVRR
jgi:hypothetical protein